MKIQITKAFDYPFPSGAMMHCTPSADPVTVKREIGEFGVAKGCAVEVKDDKTLKPKAGKATPDAGKTSDVAKAGRVAGTDNPDDSRDAHVVVGNDGPGE